MTRQKNGAPPHKKSPSPCGRRVGVRAADHPAYDKTRPAPNTPAKTLTLLALLALALPAAGKTCGTVVYKGKKTNIPCSVAIPNGKRPPPPKPTSNIVPPIQLPGDPRLHPPRQSRQDAATRPSPSTAKNAASNNTARSCR